MAVVLIYLYVYRPSTNTIQPDFELNTSEKYYILVKWGVRHTI